MPMGAERGLSRPFASLSRQAQPAPRRREFGGFRRRGFAAILARQRASRAASARDDPWNPLRFTRAAPTPHDMPASDGAPCSAKWLAKLAVVGGGPQFRKIGRFPVYTRSDLDEWVEAKITAPRRSTSVSA
jgi:hypothetical protein